MKILFYNHTGQVSGAERVLLAMLPNAPKDAPKDAVLLCPAASPLFALATANGVRCVPMEELHARFTWRLDRLASYLWSFYQVMRSFRAQVKQMQPGLIHANSVRAGLVAYVATILLRIPVIWHIHDSLPRHPFSVLIRWLALSSSRNHLLGVSHAVIKRFRSRLSLFVSRPLAHVIHNGVEVDRFQSDSQSREAVRNEWKLRADDLALGIIGQITPRKGQLALIRAYAAVAQRVPQVTLFIIGAPLFAHDHAYLVRLKRTVKALGIAERVRFLGARHDIPAVMRALDLSILNSHSDPFPLTMLEAMASGTPVLATAVDGIPELIRHGETGWLVPPRDEAQLAEAMLYLIAEPELRQRLATQGRQQILAGFTAEHFQRAIAQYFHKIYAAQHSPVQSHPTNKDVKV
jgi:L-malate glycosyltransferase